MPTNDDLILYNAQVLRAVRERFLADLPLPPFPGEQPPPPVSVQLPGGIEIVGPVRPTWRPNLFLAPAGAQITVNGARAKLGATADDRDSWSIGEPLPYLVTDPNPILPGTPVTFRAGDALVIAKRVGVALEETFMVAEQSLYPAAPPLASWPRILLGATAADVQTFLDDSNWFAEVAEGWQGRAGHGSNNWEPADPKGLYGGEVAKVTSLGALLLIADLPDDQKLRVQTRLLEISQDLELFNIRYPANGGHGVGRLFPWLVRRKLGIPTRLQLNAFAELEHIVPGYGGTDSLEGYGWRHTLSSPIDMASPYFYCCTANRWAGAALAASLIPGMVTIGEPGLFNWADYTRAYLRRYLPQANDWFVMDARSRALILANRAALGF